MKNQKFNECIDMCKDISEMPINGWHGSSMELQKMQYLSLRSTSYGCKYFWLLIKYGLMENSTVGTTK